MSQGTYARELGAAVAALGDSAALLDVQQAQVTTRSLDDSGPVGPGVVAVQNNARQLPIPIWNEHTRRRQENMSSAAVLFRFGGAGEGASQ